LNLSSARLPDFRAVFSGAVRIARRDVTQGLITTIVIQAGGGLVSFAMFSLAARALSPGDFGQLAMWLSICQMASVVAIFGQEMFILRSLNEYRVAMRPDLAKGALIFSMMIVGLIPACFAVAMGVVGVSAFNNSISLAVSTGVFLIGSSVIAVSSHIARSSVGIVIADGIREIFWRLLVIVGLITVIHIGRNIEIDGFFALAAAATGLAALIQAVAIWRALPGNIPIARASRRYREWSRVSFKFWASAMLETGNQYLDVVIIYWLLDPAAAGAYFIASRLANVFATILSGAHSYATRRIPLLYFGRQFDALDQTLKFMAEIVLLCIAAGVTIFGLGAETILGLFGQAFVAQKWPLLILTAGTACYAAGGPAAAVLMIAGHEGRYPWIIAANICLRFVGFAVLIPVFGLEGAASATTISLLVVTIALNILCRRWIGVDPSILVLFRKSSSNRR
jgi:O-antigen/teichoic acid export membrane protein